MRGISEILTKLRSYCPESKDEGNMVLARSIFLISPESKASQYFYCYPNQTSRANTKIHHDNLKELNKLCQISSVHPVLDENVWYTANSVHLVWLLRHNRVRAKCAGSRTHNRCAMKMTKYGAVNTRCPDARPWKIPRYIFTRLFTQSLYEQGDQGKYKEYTPPFPLLVKTRAIRFCKWPAQMSDTGNNT